MIKIRCLLFTLLMIVPTIAAPRQVRVEFPKDKSAVTLTGTLKGDDDVDYLLPVQQEQNFTIALKGGKSSPYFNVIESGKDSALFIGSTSGSKFEGKLPAKEHIVRVYQMRSAARRGTVATFTITFQKSSGK